MKSHERQVKATLAETDRDMLKEVADLRGVSVSKQVGDYVTKGLHMDPLVQSGAMFMHLAERNNLPEQMVNEGLAETEEQARGALQILSRCKELMFEMFPQGRLQ